MKDAAQTRSAPVPPVTDKESWRTLIAQNNDAMAKFTKPVGPGIDVKTETRAGVTVYRARPRSLPANDKRLYMEMLGGALGFGAGDFARAMGTDDAEDFNVEVVSVDYWVPPDHPFPDALDDSFAVYAAEMKARGAQNIIVGGRSAGGNRLRRLCYARSRRAYRCLLCLFYIHRKSI